MRSRYLPDKCSAVVEPNALLMGSHNLLDSICHAATGQSAASDSHLKLQQNFFVVYPMLRMITVLLHLCLLHKLPSCRFLLTVTDRNLILHQAFVLAYTMHPRVSLCPQSLHAMLQYMRHIYALDRHLEWHHTLYQHMQCNGDLFDDINVLCFCR